jgi:hypothetical protein
MLIFLRLGPFRAANEGELALLARLLSTESVIEDIGGKRMEYRPKLFQNWDTVAPRFLASALLVPLDHTEEP